MGQANLEERINIVFELGKYYGYPQCCIVEFIEDIINNRNSSVRSSKSDNTGFIPCTKHYIQIMKGDIELKDLIDSRCCPHEFPIDHKIKQP